MATSENEHQDCCAVDTADAQPGEGGDSCCLDTDGQNAVQGVAVVTNVKATSPSGGGETGRKSGWLGLVAMVPGVGASLLPLGVCAACWPAYAGLLGSVGLGFLLETTYLLPLVAALFVLALSSLAYRARSRRGYGPFGLGVVGSGIALVGKFAFSSDPLLYVGLVLLLGASLWNSWPRKACAVRIPKSEIESHA